MTELRLRMRLMRGEEIALGPGKVDLLEGIERTGSISAAGRELGMSYRRAWKLVETMNRCFANPLVETAKGGHSGGGANLTPEGRQALAAYREMESLAQDAVQANAQTLQDMLAPEPGANVV
jgi:molybdate transport system regulatory protein